MAISRTATSIGLRALCGFSLEPMCVAPLMQAFGHVATVRCMRPRRVFGLVTCASLASQVQIFNKTGELLVNVKRLALTDRRRRVPRLTLKTRLAQQAHTVRVVALGPSP